MGENSEKVNEVIPKNNINKNVYIPASVEVLTATQN
jgi:hypothetical protein